MIRKRKKVTCSTVEIFFNSLLYDLNNCTFAIARLSIIMLFFNEYNYQQFQGQMKGNRYSNVEDFHSMFHVTWTTFKFNRNQLGTASAFVMISALWSNQRFHQVIGEKLLSNEFHCRTTDHK